MPQSVTPTHVSSFPDPVLETSDITGKTTGICHPPWHLPSFFSMEGQLSDFGTPFAERQFVDAHIYNPLPKSALVFFLKLLPKDCY